MSLEDNMKNWLANNIIQLLLILASVTFGYANFTADIKANADDIKRVEDHQKDYEKKSDEKMDKAIKLLERIDERTKRL